MCLAVNNVRMSFGNDKTQPNCVDIGPASIYIHIDGFDVVISFDVVICRGTKLECLE